MTRNSVGSFGFCNPCSEKENGDFFTLSTNMLHPEVKHLEPSPQKNMCETSLTEIPSPKLPALAPANIDTCKKIGPSRIHVTAIFAYIYQQKSTRRSLNIRYIPGSSFCV